LAGRKLGEFGESSVIRQTKTIQISTYNYNILAEFIHSPNFFRQMLETSKFAKLSPHQTFPLYGIMILIKGKVKCLKGRHMTERNKLSISYT